MIRAIAERHIMYNKQTEYIQEREKSGDIFVLRPEKPLKLKHAEHDPKKLRYAYDTGRELALKKLPEIKKFLRLEDTTQNI